MATKTSDGLKVAILATDGFEQVELTEPRKALEEAGKPIAVICHGPWLLASAGLVTGHTIQDDIRNAGGPWIDDEVVRDENWISSRQPSDIPAFNRETVSLFAERGRNRPQAA